MINILSHFKQIKTFVFDVDGVLTDGGLLVLNDGQMARKMNIKDGYALQLAVKKKYRIIILSGGDSESVKARLHKLGITEVFMQAHDKKSLLINYVNEHSLSWSEMLFMGDDIPDFLCMQLVGLPCCPADSAAEIKNISKYISPYKGGRGCVRDVIEKVLKLNEDWDMHTESPAV